ncbi:LysE family translocator [Phyllobacterium sp. 22229]|uniref:LysE family translocator n=1 Tax=Agrobacterium radiobacter TaxID=362 RepID=A0ABD5LPA2_AGRRD
MKEALFISFLAATLVILSTPGASCALATSQAMRYGPRAALLTVAGDAMGSVVHIIIATIGLQFLIGMASSVLPWLQVAGGIYILYLAQQSFQASKAALHSEGRTSGGTFEAMFSGFIACVSNPKAIIFFAALFPGFIDPNFNVVFQSAVYGTIFIILDVISILGYALLAVLVFKSKAFSRINYNTFSGIGLALIGILLVIKGMIEIFQ